MKSIFNLLLLVALVSVSYSCDKATDVAKGTKGTIGELTDKKPTILTDSLLTRGAFDTMRTKWQNDHKLYTDRHVFNYFEIPIDDLRAIVGEPGITDSRFYFGMSADTMPHLMLVGITGSGLNFNIIADYTKVCPTQCN
jgi:hypothetical protein